jgi:hypothetical protein
MIRTIIIALATLLVSTVVAAGNTIYAQLSSAIDQSEGQFKAEIVDGLNGMEYDTDAGLTATKAGEYLIVFVPQTGADVGCGNYWLRVNDWDVDNSNIRVCQTDPSQTVVAISQGIVTLEKGDTITFRMSGNLGTQATQPVDEPLVPSAIITVYKL